MALVKYMSLHTHLITVDTQVDTQAYMFPKRQAQHTNLTKITTTQIVATNTKIDMETKIVPAVSVRVNVPPAMEKVGMTILLGQDI